MVAYWLGRCVDDSGCLIPIICKKPVVPVVPVVLWAEMGLTRFSGRYLREIVMHFSFRSLGD
jgi:hypothetical protein